MVLLLDSSFVVVVSMMLSNTALASSAGEGADRAGGDTKFTRDARILAGA